MISCGHMLATKNTVEKDQCFTSVPQNMFFVVFLQIAVSFSCISFCDFAVESCSFGMHSGGTTGRRKKKTGRGGGWAGIRVWASN